MFSCNVYNCVFNFGGVKTKGETITLTMRLLSLILVVTSAKVATCQRSGCNSLTDLIFILDSSGSLEENPDRAGNWNAIRRFVSMAIVNLGDTVERQYPSASGGVRVALVQFAESARLTFGLNTYRNYNDAASAVLSVQNFGGSTSMAAGLQLAETLLPPQSSFNTRNTIVVLVSDFKPNVERNELFIAQRIKNRNDVKIVSVGVQGQVDEVLLRQIASENRVVLSEDYTALLSNISPLINVMCEDTPSQPGRQCARDIVMVLDASISISTWNALKEFAALVAANLANADPNTRIGVVTFSDSAMVTSSLVPYSPFLANSIITSAHSQGLTNIADGFRRADELFPDPSRQRHVIIFTDGVSTRETGQEAGIAANMRNKGINIIAYGVGPTIDRGRLESLVADNFRSTHVIINPTYSTTMISQINAVTSLTACALDPQPPCIQQEADIVLALDASGSITDKGPDNWRRMQDFAVELIRQLVDRYPGVRIGALSFSEQATWLSPLTTNYFGLAQAIQGARHANSYTNQAAAFRMAGDIFSRSLPTQGAPRRRFVIMVTDGEPTIEVGLEIGESQRLQQQDVTTVLVGVTTSINRNNLNSIASRPDTVVYSEDFNALNSVPMITAVVRATTNNCPAGGESGGSARDIPPTTTTCYAADVIFAMDRSGSIEARVAGNFQRMKDFVSEIARSLHQRYSQVRFGLVIFSDQADVISWLERYNNVETFVNIIQSINYLGSRTNLAAAIREARRALGRHATRSPQIILVTDGEATEEIGREDAEAEITRSFGIRISAIAVTMQIQEAALTRLTNNVNQVFRAPNFESIRREIVSVTRVACERPGDSAVSCNGLPEIVFLLDVSASITPDESRMAKEFIINSIETFQRGNSNSQFGLVIFSTYARIVFSLTSDLNYIRNMVSSVRSENGRTNIAEGLERAAQVLAAARSGSRRFIIIITDGLPNDRIGQEIGIAGNIKNTGTIIIPVGVTEYGPDYPALEVIASSPDGVVRALNFAMLSNRIGELTQVACRTNNNVLIPEPPRLPPTPEPAPPRQPFPGFPSPPAINSPGLPITCPGTHIVLLIDNSRRLNPTQIDLDRTKNLVSDVIRHISSSKPNTKFAIITYDSTGKVEESFSPSRSTNELVHIVSSIQIRNTQDSYFSNIARGLFSSRNTIGSSINTQDVASLIVLFSDGVSNLDSGIEFTEARIVRSMGIKLLVVAIGSPSISSLSGLTGDMSLLFNAPNRQLPPGTIDKYVPYCGSQSNQQLAFLRDDNHCPEEIVFVLDSGGNKTMETENRKHATNFLSSIVEEYARFYDIRGRFAAVQFSDVAEVALPFSKDLPFVTYTLTHLKHLNYSEDIPSNLAKGLNLAKELFEDNSRKKLVVAITDEVADLEITNEILAEVNGLKDLKIDIIVVGISEGPKDDIFFEEIAGSSGRVISLNEYEELKNEVNNLINTACEGQVIFRKNDKFSLTP